MEFDDHVVSIVMSYCDPLVSVGFAGYARDYLPSRINLPHCVRAIDMANRVSLCVKKRKCTLEYLVVECLDGSTLEKEVGMMGFSTGVSTMTLCRSTDVIVALLISYPPFGRSSGLADVDYVDSAHRWRFSAVIDFPSGTILLCHHEPFYGDRDGDPEDAIMWNRVANDFVRCGWLVGTNSVPAIQLRRCVWTDPTVTLPPHVPYSKCFDYAVSRREFRSHHIGKFTIISFTIRNDLCFFDDGPTFAHSELRLYLMKNGKLISDLTASSKLDSEIAWIPRPTVIRFGKNTLTVGYSVIHQFVTIDDQKRTASLPVLYSDLATAALGPEL